MELSPTAQRVLGALAEKRLTTPQQYPLTLNALVGACNQRSAREPVMELAENEVHQGLRQLREHELCRTAGTRGRTSRYEHRLDVQLDLDDADQSVLGVLLLRGPQTVGEIRTRTDRWHTFADLGAVEAQLAELVAHPFLPLVAELPREPGRREARWTHLLGDGTPAPAAATPDIPTRDGPTPDTPVATAPASTEVPVLRARVRELEAELEELRGQVSTANARIAGLLEQLS